MNKNKQKYLEERLLNFSLSVLKLVKSLSKTDENKIYGKQIIRSSSSIGANYSEAVFAHTKQDFIHTLNISRKEAGETVYWLKLLRHVNKQKADKITEIIDENEQILRIFISSVKTGKENLQNGK